jgi:ferric-dicitrate binding protein FerR (iron transport regulator)
MTSVDAEKNCKLIVFDGIVEVSTTNEEKTVLVNAGQEVEIINGKRMPTPSSVDLSTISKWRENR